MIRYAVAVAMVLGAVFLTLSRPVLADAPYIFFLGAIIVSALLGGLGPGFFATALSTASIRLFFVEPRRLIFKNVTEKKQTKTNCSRRQRDRQHRVRL